MPIDVMPFPAPVFPMLSKHEVRHGCGAGMRSLCCIYLVVGAEGFQCGRETVFREPLEARTDMNAKRRPTEPYPHCQLVSH
jgi:hypothetical protein